MKKHTCKKVFISSTCFNLKDLRAELAISLKEWGYTPIWNESPDFPKKPSLHSHDQCLNAVENCDIYLLIIDNRYGGIYAGERYPKEDISITWYEAKVAFKKNKEMYIYVRNEVWIERATYKKNLNNGIQITMQYVDNPKVFELIDYIDNLPRDNWIETFKDSVDLKEKLRIRLIALDYKDYFTSISNLRQKEFDHLDNWVDVFALEAKLASLGKQNRAKIISAIDLIDECIEASRNVVIFGESGSGKTFTCLKLFEKLKKEYYHQEVSKKVKIPLFIELYRIRNNDLDKILRENIDEIQFKLDKDKYFIFLDGLNEVGGLEEQKRVFIEINRFRKLNPETRLFVTTQTVAEYHQMAGFDLYEIQPFRKKDIINYLCNFKDMFESYHQAEYFYDNLPELVKTFISIPVFLYFLVSTYKKDWQVKINNPGELISLYEKFLCGVRESRPIDLDKDYRTRVIPFIAFNMCHKNMIDIPQIQFNKYIEQYNENNHSTIDEREIRNAVTNRFTLMKMNEKDGFKFIHQILRDYFAALYMKNNNFNSNEIEGLVYTDSTLNNDLVNAIRLLVGIVDPKISKNIINVFIARSPYLACEIFAWSSIASCEQEFTDLMISRLDIHSNEYPLYLNSMISFYLKVLNILEKEKRNNDPLYAFYMEELGTAYSNKLDHERAIDAYKKAVEIYRENKLETCSSYAGCFLNLGNVYYHKSDFEQAKKEYEKAIKLFTINKMKEYSGNALCHMNLGNVYAENKKYSSAIKLYNKAISIYEKNNMHAFSDYAMCLTNLGTVYAEKNNYYKAIKHFKHATLLFEKNNMQTHPDYAKCLTNLGTSYRIIGKEDKAKTCLNLALNIYELTVDEEHPDFKLCMNKNLNIKVLVKGGPHPPYKKWDNDAILKLVSKHKDKHTANNFGQIKEK